MVDEAYRIHFAPDKVLTSGDTIWSVHAHSQKHLKYARATMGFQRIAEAYRCALPALYCDLLDIALAVYASDRMCPRHAAGIEDRYGMHWRRHIAIQLPVRDPAHWNASVPMTSLCALLEHLTGNRWSFDFAQRSLPGHQQARQQYLFRWQPAGSLEVAPFSGGLDSLAGAYHRLASDPDRVLSVVVGGTSSRMQARQSDLLAALQEHFGSRLLPVRIRYGLWNRNYSADDDEPSQRSRGFVHLALTAISALMLESPSAAVYENGIGALGLPYSRGQIGTHISRAVHPLTLTRMGGFVDDALGRFLKFHNPFVFETKGTMCARLSAEWLRDPVARSVSCDEFPQRVADRPQCGICPACVLRRISLHHAGLVEVDAQSGYRFDVTKPTHTLGERRLYRLRTMLDQVDLFRTCLEGSAWEELTMHFPDLAEAGDVLVREYGLSYAQVTDALVALYRSYTLEWDGFPYQLPAGKLKLCS